MKEFCYFFLSNFNCLFPSVTSNDKKICLDKHTNVFDSECISFALLILVVSATYIARVLPPFIIEDLYYTFFLQLQNN